MSDPSTETADAERPSEPQEPVRDLSLKTYLGRWFQDLFHLDRPTWRCLRAVLFRPGEIAAAHCRDVRDGTPHRDGEFPLHPIRLYLIVNVFFFFLAPWISKAHNGLQVSLWKVDFEAPVRWFPSFGRWMQERAQSSGFSEVGYQAIFTAWMSSLQGSTVFIWIPVLGLASFLAYRRRRPFIVEHLIFSTHMVSFVLLSMLALGLASRPLIVLPRNIALWSIVILVMSWLVWFMGTFFRGVRDFHAIGSRWTATLLSLWLVTALGLAVQIYLVLLFLSAHFGLRGLKLPAA